ncbi:MAG: T9SS type A sorting domain-containing protein [Flavobacteriales bacterium]|jgi:hypothetical protein|nr:T9SS type A sorting domain-containing protein [Flavobacteriales bacterium]
MKTSYITLIICSLIQYEITAQTTLDKPQFSIESGFYTSDITLNCSCSEPGAELRYTIDGSTPSLASTLYTQPLLLGSRVGEPNDISMISTGYDWAAPNNEIFKGHVISAKCFKSGFLDSKTKANTYFIDSSIDNRYETVSVVSLIADAGNFFDYDTGIYVLGINEPICQMDACGNYGMRGDAWEREVHFEFWESSQNSLAISRNLGVRIHGGATRNHAQKAIRFYARDEYGKKNLEYPLFGEAGPTSFKRFMLRAGGNDGETMVRDSYHHQFFTGAGVETQLYKPCVLFVNGEFWGYHGLRESYNKHYFNSYYAIDKDSIDYISEGPSDIVLGGVVADEGDMVSFDTLLYYIDNNDISTSAGYNYVANEVDILSLSTIYIAEMFVGNQDWPGNNVKLWRPKDNSRKWEWCLVDTDIAGVGNMPVNMFSLDIPPGEGSYTEPIILEMLTNAEFLDYYINRWADLLNTRLLSSNTGSKLDLTRDNMAQVIDEQYERWDTPQELIDWLPAMNDQKNWMEQRVPIVWDELEDYYTITKANITLDVSSASHGSIQCNTIPPNELTNFPWSGDYFIEVPIHLKAVNKPGYQFIEWVGDVSSIDKEITVSVTAGMNITAVFEPLTKSIVINELIASNNSSSADGAGEYDDWIELYNTTGNLIDLSGYFLSDDILNLSKWSFPNGTTIGPNDYLIIWSDNDLSQAGLHTSFKLKKSGTNVILSNQELTIIDETNFGHQTTDITWGRYPNGTGSFVNMNPTYAATNSSALGIKTTDDITDSKLFKIYPNPTRGSFTVELKKNSNSSIIIYNALGVATITISNPLQYEVINVSSWQKGLYYIRVGQTVRKLAVN